MIQNNECNKKGYVGQEENISIPRYLGVGLLSGFAIGSITGFLEVLILTLAGGNSAISGDFFFDAVFLYGMGWSTIVTFFAFLYACLTAIRHQKSSLAKIISFCISLGVSISFLIMGGGYINLFYLPMAIDIRAIVFDIVLLAICPVLFFILNKVLRRFHGSFNDKVRLNKFVISSLSTIAILILFSSAISYIPFQKDRILPREIALAGDTNVILIVIDALRSDHLSLYGYDKLTDPNLKTFSQDAVTFFRASAQSSWTKPSVATILTSLYPSTHKANSLGAVLPDSVLTLSEILQERGFRTGFFSGIEWISPLFNFRQGVDYFFVNTSSKIDKLIAGHILDMVSRFSVPVRGIYKKLIEFDRFLQAGSFLQHEKTAPEITKRTLEWIEANKDSPLFTYIHYIDPHTPYSPPCPNDIRFDARFGNKAVSWPPPFTGLEPFEKAAPVLPEQKQELIARYDSEIYYCDYWLGRLFEGLNKFGLFDKSLIIVTSDHGEEFFEHDGWDHGHSLYEESIHVPLIVKLPGNEYKGTKNSSLVRHLDIAPTILDVVGIKKGTDMDGLSLLPIIRGSKDLPSPIFSVSELDLGGGRLAKAIRTIRYKLIQTNISNREAIELFDLQDDPHEKINIYEMKPECARRLFSELQLVHSYARSKSKRDANTVKIDPSLEERLRSLGYLK